MGSLRKNNGPLKVPRLRMKDELIQFAPELAKLLGEEVEDPEKDFNTNRLDTPRGHEEEFTEAEELQRELAAVKKDRSELIHSLAHIKTNLVGSGGGEAQTMQIVQLEKELALKKLTLNDLRTEGKKLDKRISDCKTNIHDAILLTPGGYENEIATIKQLMSDINRLEEDLIEAEAKNRLYYLLGERTRQDHLEMERKVREARAMKTNALEDHNTLTQHMHDVRAAKEDSERQLSKMKRMLEDAKKDWLKKLRDRKKEVQELKRRQDRDELREIKRKERQEEESRKEQERLKKIALEQEAHEMQIQELAPKIDAMEASWNRLRTITGADEPEEVIAYWEGLKSKEENMRQLVAAAETTEASVKTRIEELLRRRNEMLEQDLGTQSTSSAVDNIDDYEVRIADAHRKMSTTRKKFQKLRTVCISAEQGLKSMLDNIKVALQEMSPAELMPTSSIPQGTPPRTGKKMERRESYIFRKAGHNRDSRRIASPKTGILAEGDEILMENGTSQLLKLGSSQNTIDNKAFFEHLPTMLTQVSEKVTKLMQIEEESLVNLSTMEAVVPAPEEEPLPEDEKANSETADTGAPAEGDAPAGTGTDATLAAGTNEGVEAAADGLANEKTGGNEVVSGGAAAGAEETAGSAEEASTKGSGWAEEGGAAKEQAQAGTVAGEATAQDAESKGAAAAGVDSSAGGPSAAAPSPAEEPGLASGRQAYADEPSTAAADKPTGPPETAAATKAEPTVDVAKAVEAAQMAAARVPQAETLLDTILRDKEPLHEDLEKRMILLNKGMRKLDWSGAPLMDPVNPTLKPVLPDLSTLTRRAKGRKRASDKPAQLERIMGYTEDAADDEEEEEEDEGENDDKDGVLERETIKRTAAKMEARAAKALSEATQ